MTYIGPMLWLWIIAAPAGQATAPPELLVKKLAALAGPNARDCGSIASAADSTPAIACARDAASSGAAYRLSVQMKQSDSYTWQGAARDEHGRQWVVFYDADSAGGANASPGLGQLLCRSISFTPDKDEVLDCQPDTGAR